MRKIKLSRWAKENAACYRTAWNYFQAGKFAGRSEKTPQGTIFIWEAEPPKVEEPLEKPLEEFAQAARNLAMFLSRKYRAS